MLMGQGRGGAGTGPPNSRLQHAPWDREHEDAHFRIQNGIRADVTLVLLLRPWKVPKGETDEDTHADVR
jgi:hypothetical protein